MSRKERTKTRRNNYRAWKQAQKQKQKSATPAASAAAAPPAEPPSPATAPQVEEEPKASEPVNIPTAPDSPPPGALIPYNPSARVDLKLLLQRLRLGGPEVTDEERIAIAHRLEQHVDSTYGGLIDPKEIEGSRQKLRSLLTHALSRFGIPWPPAGESEPAPSDEAPGHSTGPRTPAGKDRSSQNARTHGLSSLTSVFVLLPGEDQKKWIELLRDLTSEFQPVSRTERILVTDMAQSHWLTQRAINLQTNSIEDPKAFALYLCYQTTHQRAYYRALKQLLALQKARAQSDAPHIATHPAPDFDGTVDLDTIPDPSIPDSAPVAPQPDTSTEPMTLPQAA
jgi:hypothetical protein